MTADRRLAECPYCMAGDGPCVAHGGLEDMKREAQAKREALASNPKLADTIEPYLQALTRYIDGVYTMAMQYNVPAKDAAFHAKHMQDAVLSIRRILESAVETNDAQDAARYRFLRQPGNAIVYAKDKNAWGDSAHFAAGHVRYDTPEQLDAAIDTARLAEKTDGSPS